MYFGVKIRLTFTPHLKLKLAALLHDFMSEKNNFLQRNSFLPCLFFFQTEFPNTGMLFTSSLSLLLLRAESKVDRVRMVKAKWFPKWAGNSTPSGCYCRILQFIKPF